MNYKSIRQILIVLLTLVLGMGGMAPVPRLSPAQAAGSPPPMIRLQYAAFDPLAGEPDIPYSQRQQFTALTAGLATFLIQFTGPVQEDWKAKVEATGEGVDRVLNNLVSNAVKYTPEGGRVSVMLHRVNGHAYVQVSDTGIGIPEEVMLHLFEEFYRAPNAKALEKEGTGLGLTITRDLIAHYDGRITVIWPTMRDA